MKKVENKMYTYGNEREEEKEGKRKYAFIPFITFGIDKNSIYKH